MYWLFKTRNGRHFIVANPRVTAHGLARAKSLGVEVLWDSAPTHAAAVAYARTQNATLPTRRVRGIHVAAIF